MKKFLFADLHCHPTLKPFGKSFSKRTKNSDIWHRKKPNVFSKYLNKVFGITKFSQTDFHTMAKGGVKIAFVSLYPFEKGFFKNSFIPNKVLALISSFITSIGYKRVRYIQKHTDYFKDLLNEFEFLNSSREDFVYNGETFSWNYLTTSKDLDFNNGFDNKILVIPTIEGAHVFNSGLSIFGKITDEDEILKNIYKVKKLSKPPMFITFSHNFNNDFCGHAPSLQPLGFLVDQSVNLDLGFSELGFKVLNTLLNQSNGKRIYIDVKHMSLKSRLQYYNFIEKKYNNSVPVIVSHGAVTGQSLKSISGRLSSNIFSEDSINFYDEELMKIAKSKGLFAIQFDAKRLADKAAVNKNFVKNNNQSQLKKSTEIIWNQLRHIAEVLDKNGFYAWGTTCIGSDFDGTINPLSNIWTSEDFNAMANQLLVFVEDYLSKKNKLIENRNSSESPIKIVKNFTINNVVSFVNRYYVYESTS